MTNAFFTLLLSDQSFLCRFVRIHEQMENPAFKKLLAHVTAFLDENSQKTTRGKLGKEWVRGWGDSGLPSSGNQQ